MSLLNAADRIYLGGNPVDKVYVGAAQVWPPMPLALLVQVVDGVDFSTGLRSFTMLMSTTGGSPGYTYYTSWVSGDGRFSTVKNRTTDHASLSGIRPPFHAVFRCRVTDSLGATVSEDVSLDTA